MWKISYVLSTLFRQLVILMRYVSFCFDYQKTPSVLATTYKRRYAETHRAYFQAAVWKRACQSIYHLKNKDGRKMCCLLTGWTSSHEALMLLISCGCKTICATKRCSCRSQGLSCTDVHIAKARIKERLYQRGIVKVTMRKKIKTWNHSLRKKVLVVRFQVLKHKKINVSDICEHCDY